MALSARRSRLLVMASLLTWSGAAGATSYSGEFIQRYAFIFFCLFWKQELEYLFIHLCFYGFMDTSLFGGFLF